LQDLCNRHLFEVPVEGWLFGDLFHGGEGNRLKDQCLSSVNCKTICLFT
jgi:hypothetical protein